MTISGQGTRKLFIGILPDITREIKDNDEKVFSMNLGLQLGGTYFTANDPSGGWRNHTDVKFSPGYTFRSKYTAL